MVNGIILQVWPIESIPKDVKHPFETKVTHIVVGPIQSLQSIVLWDYQLQFISVLSSSITMPIQNPFSQTQLPPLSQILFWHLEHLITYVYCIQLPVLYPGNHLVDSWIHLLGLYPVGNSLCAGGDSKIRELMAFSWQA